MFQQFLGLHDRAMRIYAVLEPTGRMDDPWIVKCLQCPFYEIKPNHVAAVKLATWHDRAHDIDNERQANQDRPEMDSDERTD